MSVTQVGTPSAAAVSLGTNTPSVTGSWSGTQPRTAGDLLVAVVTNWGQTTAGAISTSTPGWSQVDQVVGGAAPQGRAATFVKAAAGADAAPTFTATNSGTATNARMEVYLIELTGEDATTPIGANGSITSTAGTSLSIATSGSVPVDGCYAIDVAAVAPSTVGTITFTAGTGFTKVYDSGATSGRLHSYVAVNGSPASGSVLTDAMSWASASGVDNAACILVVQPSQVEPNTIVVAPSAAVVQAAYW